MTPSLARRDDDCVNVPKQNDVALPRKFPLPQPWSPIKLLQDELYRQCQLHAMFQEKAHNYIRPILHKGA